MFDRMLAVGTAFDWISPVMAGLNDIVHGPSHTFFVPEHVGRSGRDIQRLLKDHGIRVWGLMVVNDNIMFTVPKRQGRWAQYVLQRSGVPLANTLDSEATSSSPGVREGTDRISSLERMEGFLDRLADGLGL